MDISPVETNVFHIHIHRTRMFVYYMYMNNKVYCQLRLEIMTSSCGLERYVQYDNDHDQPCAHDQWVVPVFECPLLRTAGQSAGL
jgi:hypothetical protein